MVSIPVPPTTEEKYSYLNTHRYLLYGIDLFSITPLVTGMTLFALLIPAMHWYLPFAILITFYLLISVGGGLLGKDYDFDAHTAIINGSMGYEEPSVDLWIPTAGEDFAILDNTLRYAAAIEYTNKKIWVLDDSGRAGVQRLANTHGAHYLSRPDRPYMKKAGNLRYAFPRTNGEFIVIFDADFAARPDFLKETLPHMLADPKIAIIQTPQYFSVKEGMNWIEKGAGYIQELFYRAVQTSRDTWGAAICCGTNALYRRKALEPFGGTALIPYSEDLHTGKTVMEAGWKIKYIPIPLAKGICPDRLSSFFSQHYRWAMGSINLMVTPAFWFGPLTFMQKLSYASGMLYYVATAASVIFTPVPILYLLYFHPDLIRWYSAVFALPSFMYSMIAVGIWNTNHWGFFYFRIRALQPWAHMFAIVDRLLGSAIEWIPTNAAGKFGRFKIYQWVASSWYFTLAILFAIGVEAKIANGDWEWLPSGILFLFHLAISLSVIV